MDPQFGDRRFKREAACGSERTQGQRLANGAAARTRRYETEAYLFPKWLCGCLTGFVYLNTLKKKIETLR